MSDTEERKSMDDVLASIRRIVRAEKDPEGVQDAVTAEAPVQTPDPVTTAPEEAAPLELTPDMLVPDAPAEEMADAVSETVEEAIPAVPAAASATALEPDAIREMVREVVMEQLGGPDGDALIRNVIRDELVTGDVGSNISKNVLRLIRTEVASALGKGG